MPEKLSTSIWTYLCAFFGDWFTGMCGPATVPFAILAIYFPQAPLKVLFGILAVICGILASYLVWRRERILRVVNKEAELTIDDEGASRFYIHIQNAPATNKQNVLGIYLQLHLSIENKGSRNSILKTFSVELVELKKIFSDVQPRLFNVIQCRRSQMGTIQEAPIKTKDKVPAEDILKGWLSLYFEGIDPGEADNLNFRLKIVDTEGVEAEHTFSVKKGG